MGWSISLGRVKGTTVRLHLTFLIFLLWLGAVAWAEGGPKAAASSVSFIILLFFCVVLHEFGHVLAARRFGVHTPDMLLLPIGGVSNLERIPDQPREELIIALAGPAVSLAIALGLIVALGGLPAPGELVRELSARAILGQLAYANLTLFVFNLLPAFPLDGGRVLRAILASRMSHMRATQLAATIGKVAALVLGAAAAAMGNLILLLVAMFVFFAAGAEAGMAQMRGILVNVPARDVMITEFHPLAPDARVADAADELIRSGQTIFPVLDGSGRFAGLLSKDGIIKALSERGADAPVATAMRSDIPMITEWHRLGDGMEMLQGGIPAIAVTSRDGRLVGLITAETLLQKLMIARASEKRA